MQTQYFFTITEKSSDSEILASWELFKSVSWNHSVTEKRIKKRQRKLTIRKWMTRVGTRTRNEEETKRDAHGREQASQVTSSASNSFGPQASSLVHTFSPSSKKKFTPLTLPTGSRKRGLSVSVERAYHAAIQSTRRPASQSARPFSPPLFRLYTTVCWSTTASFSWKNKKRGEKRMLLAEK
jgi:hypothetical protein